MCAKCECKKSFTWKGQQYVSAEGEIVAQVQTYFDHFEWNDRRFISLEAAKVVVEKECNPTGLSDADMIKRIRDIIKSAMNPSRMGHPSAQMAVRAIQRIVEIPRQ